MLQPTSCTSQSRPGRGTIRVPAGRVVENTFVTHYQPRHGVLTEVPIPSNRRRMTGVAVAGLATLLVVAIIVVISLPGGGPGASRAVATSPQGAAPKAASTVHTRGKSSIGHPNTPASGPAGSRTTVPPGPAAASPAVNLAVPSGFGPLLRRAWVAADPGRSGLAGRDIVSTLAGSVFYAEQPSARVYWAISRFVPSPVLEQTAASHIGRVMLAQFNNVAVFDRKPGGAWHYVGAFSPGTCPTNLPSSVSTAWSLCSVGS
jgi:hypothetical protein